MFFKIRASCYFIIIIVIIAICIFLTFQSEMWLVRTERIRANGRVAPNRIQGGSSLISSLMPVTSFSILGALTLLKSPRPGALEYSPHPLLPLSGVSNPRGDLRRDLRLCNNCWISFLWIKDA